MTRLRILCLHGYTSSASRLQRQLAPVAAAVEPYAQFTFVNGPFSAPPGHAWWDANTADGVTTYDGWPKSRSYLHTVFKEQGPFDGILGFSQGAILSSVLVALRPEFGFDFAVLIGGFQARDHELAKLYDREFEIPSLHVYGRGDEIVKPEASEKLAQKYKNPSRIVHDGGHIIPSDNLEPWKEFFKARFEAKQQQQQTRSSL